MKNKTIVGLFVFMAPEGEISDEKKAAWEIFNEPGQILQEI
jgi:hypothetical protein